MSTIEGAARGARRPNVVMLSVDTLRADRLSVYGYDRPTTPALERLAENAIVCDNAFTLAPFTQCACIQIFTSTRPLMYGGYDTGARGRPESIFRRFGDAGYSTAGLSTVHWVSPYYGYTGGLEEDYQLFFLDTLVGMAIGTMSDTLRLYREGRIPAIDMAQKAIPIIFSLFENVEKYADHHAANRDLYKDRFPHSKVANSGYDFDKVRRIIRKHRRLFTVDSLSYINHFLPAMLDSETWLTREWRYARGAATLLGEAAHRGVNKLLGRFDPRIQRLRNNRHKLSAGAATIADNVISLLNNRDADRPFFIWAHFKDTHHPYVSGDGPKWYTQTADYLAAMGYPRDLDPGLTFSGKKPKSEEGRAAYSALYDAAVRSTDEAVGRIVDAVDGLGHGEDTVVVFCGDHGEEIGDHGDHGHTCTLYEHNVRVPLLFRRRGMAPKRIESLTTLLDLAPTLTALAGIAPAPGWEGEVVTSSEVAARTQVLLETLCRGNCAFDHRPLYFAVRSKRYKYLWKEFQDVRDKHSPEGPELFDLEADPLEQNDLYRPDHPLLPEFHALIAGRMAEIPEISAARIAAAFGDNAPEALAGE